MPKKVLIVDDEPHIVEVVRVCLDDSGLELMEAADGEHALDLTRQAHPDLVILDVMIPKMDGYAVCREIKGDPGTQGIPVILLPATGQAADIEEGQQAGADSYLTKPFSPLKLLAEVYRHLSLGIP